ncbi:MAG: hypothetical protein FWD26_03525 [Treponema sp.]|nr:hypothetical protein [Treponema sp.]
MTEKSPSSAEISRLINLYFRGIFFAPVKLEDEGLHFPDIGLLLEKKLWDFYMKNNDCLNLKNMALKKPFEFFFPLERRKENDNYWEEKYRCITKDKKTGGVIRLIIEEDKDDLFIKRLKEQLPGRKIERNNVFSIPNNFFDNLINNEIYIYYDEFDDRGGKELYLYWNFTRMNPPVFHTLKGQEKRISIYDTYNWYAEKEYTQLYLGAANDNKEVNLEKLIKSGGEYCRAEIMKSYWGENPDGDLFFIIEEMLETPVQNNEQKDLDRLKMMVFGERKRRKNKQLNRGEKNPNYLTPNDIQNIKNIAETVRELLTEEEQDKLDADRRDGIINLAKSLKNHLSNPFLRKNIRNSSSVNTINAICVKIDENSRSLNKSLKDKEDYNAREIIDTLKDNNSIKAEDAFLKQEEDKIKNNFLNKEFKSICLEGFKLEFDCEDEEEDFYLYIQKKTWLEITDLLVPYTSNESNVESVLFNNYCEILKISLNRENLAKLHTRFAKKIRNIFIIIKEKAHGSEIKEAYQ